MYRLGQVELLYVHQSKDENYNPITEEISRTIKCSLMDAFSLNYYQNQTRDMRKSRNIIVPKSYTYDIEEDGKKYQLEYCKLNSLRYKVKNILIDKSTSLNLILDCEEIINE